MTPGFVDIHTHYDGQARLDQTATGYEATIVSGNIIRRYDKPTGRLPGRMLRGAQRAPSRR